MITILQRTDGTVQLSFPAGKDYISTSIIEWLTKNTEQKWIHNKWGYLIGVEITSEDLVAFKLKFPL